MILFKNIQSHVLHAEGRPATGKQILFNHGRSQCGISLDLATFKKIEADVFTTSEGTPCKKCFP